MTPVEVGATVAIASGGIGYLLYGELFTLTRLAAALRRGSDASVEVGDAEAVAGDDSSYDRALIVRRIIGGVLLGALPLAAVHLAGGGGAFELLGLGFSVGGGAGIGSLAMLAYVPAMVLIARRPATWQKYPQLRRRTITPGWLAGNLGSWLCYLIGYELWFRGLLLFGLAAVAPPAVAVAASAVVYTFAHLPNGREETLASAVSGVLFGWLALETGSVMPPLVAHIAIAWTNDLACTAFDPSRRVVGRARQTRR